MDVTLNAAQWRSIAEKVFTAWGTPADVAASVARSLVETHLVGIPSHGLARVAEYAGFIKAGWLLPGGRPSIVKETPTTTMVDGAYGFGQPAAMLALEASIPKARGQGIAAASICHCGHVGRLGEYAERAAAAGLVSIIAGSSGGNGGLVVPFGGMERVFSTNPIAAGVPARGHAPFIMDFATSTVAAAKLELAADKTKPIPEGWAIDKEGRPARTAQEFLDGGGLLPFGGHKGYALSLLAELIASGLSGAHLPLAPLKERGLGFAGNASFMILIDIGFFTDAERFLDDVGSLFSRLEGVKPAAGFTRVMVPGAPEQEKRRSNPEGILTLEGAVWDRITAIAAEKGVDLSA
jgi:hydroxycarboxylate dehydrogenase B